MIMIVLSWKEVYFGETKDASDNVGELGNDHNDSPQVVLLDVILHLPYHVESEVGDCH